MAKRRDPAPLVAFRRYFVIFGQGSLCHRLCGKRAKIPLRSVTLTVPGAGNLRFCAITATLRMQ
jgi:hypothetical protein